MKSSVDLAASLCRAFEGFFAKPYTCPAGVPTIGYGTTIYPDGRKVTLNDPAITRETAEALLHHELLALEPHILRLCPAAADSPRRAAALLDFCYNLGWPRLRASTLRKKVNAKDWDGARIEILKWNKAGGKVLKGLALRRQAEAALLRG